MADTQAAGTVDFALDTCVRVVQYARINTLLTGATDVASHDGVRLGFLPQEVLELAPDGDPRAKVLFAYGPEEVIDLDQGPAETAAALARLGLALASDAYCRVLVRCAAGEPMAARVSELLARCGASAWGPTLAFGDLVEYQVGPCGERRHVVPEPYALAARLVRTLEGIGGTWTLTGEEVHRAKSYGTVTIAVESLAGGFRERRHLSVAGLGIEIRL